MESFSPAYADAYILLSSRLIIIFTDTANVNLL